MLDTNALHSGLKITDAVTQPKIGELKIYLSFKSFLGFDAFSLSPNKVSFNKKMSFQCQKFGRKVLKHQKFQTL